MNMRILAVACPGTPLLCAEPLRPERPGRGASEAEGEAGKAESEADGEAEGERGGESEADAEGKGRRESGVRRQAG